MSFSVSFFARDRLSAEMKLREADAPPAVKVLIELAIAGVPYGVPHDNCGAAGQPISAQGAAGNGEKATTAANRPTPAPRRLCGILVETHGHIDVFGGRSGINLFRVEPYYDN